MNKIIDIIFKNIKYIINLQNIYIHLYINQNKNGIRANGNRRKQR